MNWNTNQLILYICSIFTNRVEVVCVFGAPFTGVSSMITGGKSNIGLESAAWRQVERMSSRIILCPTRFWKSFWLGVLMRSVQTLSVRPWVCFLILGVSPVFSVVVLSPDPDFVGVPPVEVEPVVGVRAVDPEVEVEVVVEWFS